MTNLIFASMAGTLGAAREALLWARSIRAFAGIYADVPVWLLVPNHKERLPTSIRVEMEEAGVRLISYAIRDEELDFPFAGKTIAAGIAETLAAEQASVLVWMDRDSLIIQEPYQLMLADGKLLGFRPVDHALVGSRIFEPLDPFWSLIYTYCGADARAAESMVTSVDEVPIRPYFNAGMLVVRPQFQLLAAWSENFRSFYTLPAFAPYYEQDMLYRLFVHQAILAGTILANTRAQERQEMPHLVNYPLHLHDSYPPAKRPASLSDVVTCRYDILAGRPKWEQLIAIDEPLGSWLQEQRLALDMIEQE